MTDETALAKTQRRESFVQIICSVLVGCGVVGAALLWMYLVEG